MAEEGLITSASAHHFAKTLTRLEAALKEKNLTIFARVDHAAGAASVSLNLRNTSVVIFGNPKGGTPLMQINQKIGLELPLKILVWEDASGQTWLCYDDPAWVARRFGIEPSFAAVMGLSNALAAITEQAGRP
jgi:uncharacterized protein (DUF302 family)